jgi:hypothetical protein
MIASCGFSWRGLTMSSPSPAAAIAASFLAAVVSSAFFLRWW